MTVAESAAIKSAGEIANYRRWRGLTSGLAGEVHPGRWEKIGLSPAAVERLLGESRSRFTISRHMNCLYPGLALATDGDWETWEALSRETPETAAALLPGEDIWAYGLRLGAVVFRARIATLVLRSEVVSFKAAVGEDCYFFALRQAGLIRGCPDWEDEQPILETLSTAVFRVAGWGLGCWLAAMPEDLASRVGLKIPPLADDNAKEAKSWPMEKRRAWLAVFKRVFAMSNL